MGKSTISMALMAIFSSLFVCLPEGQRVKWLVDLRNPWVIILKAMAWDTFLRLRTVLQCIVNLVDIQKVLSGELPSGYVKIAIENGHRNSGFSH